MKKIYLVIAVIFLLIAHPFSAQTNWSLHSYDDYPKLLVNVNGFQFFVNTIYSGLVGNTGSLSDTTIVFGVSKIEKIKFRHTIPLGEYVNIKSSIKTLDNQLLIVGEYLNSCDVIGINKTCLIMKIDTIGVTQFMQTPTVTYTTGNGFAQAFTSVIQKPDSSFLVFSTDYIHQYSKLGSLTSTLSHSLGSINASAINSNSTIIVSHSSSSSPSINSLSILDLTGAIINTSTVTNSYSKFLQNSLGDYYGFTSNHVIEKINPSLTTINTSSLSQGAFLINDFDILNDTIYACGKNASNHSAILKFDGNLTSQYINTLSNPNYNFTSISCQANSLNIVSNDWATNSALTYTLTNNSTSYFKTNLSGNINLNQDAYVMDYTVNNGYAYSLPQTNTMSPIYSEYHYQLKVNVFNASADTLKSVYLNMLPRNFQGICGKKFYHQLYTNLSIAPNTFSTIFTNYINDETYSGSSLVAGTTYTLSNVCFWTSSPNFKSDANHANDAYCGNVILPVTTGLKEINAETITVIAYPNPTYDNLQFNHLKDGINYMVTCYNITGEEKQTQLISTQNNEMNMMSLDNGIYILKISDGTHTIHQKIIKQD